MTCKCDKEQSIKIKYLKQYQHELKPAKVGDAGIDIVASEDMTIGAFETALISTGLYLEIPEGYYGRLVGRSSLHKQGLHVNEGIIDSGYRGEVMVSTSYTPPLELALTRHERLTMPISRYDNEYFIYGIRMNNKPFAMLKGDRIAQLIITKVEPVEFIVIDELSDSERGNKGFGSTGR